MTKPYSHFEPWERDGAHLAIDGWLRAYRESHPDAGLPSLGFAEHLGGEAVQAAVEGTPKVELMRIYAAAGYDGVCGGCGITPESSAIAVARARERDKSERKVRR